ncbi:MAG: RHS repeat-associated core domain-containing protein [Anaerolineae bacterium]
MAVSFAHLDGANVTANSSGVQISKLLYKPWGETRFTTGTTPTTWRFTGQREDATIGLYFYNARYLDPQLGRFTQPDTIVPAPGNPQALNRYSYVLNNPVRYTDPTGHLTEEELQTLLGSDYDTLISLWRQYDPYWMVILEAIQGGGVLQASMLAEIELHFEGSGKNIRLNVYNGSYSKQLWDWQGKGAYRVQNPGMISADADQFRDQLFNSSENTGLANTVVVPVFDYARRVNGRVQPTYLGAQMVNQSVGRLALVKRECGNGSITELAGIHRGCVKLDSSFGDQSFAWPIIQRRSDGWCPQCCDRERCCYLSSSKELLNGVARSD